MILIMIVVVMMLMKRLYKNMVVMIVMVEAMVMIILMMTTKLESFDEGSSCDYRYCSDDGDGTNIHKRLIRIDTVY